MKESWPEAGDGTGGSGERDAERPLELERANACQRLRAVRRELSKIDHKRLTGARAD